MPQRSVPTPPVSSAPTAAATRHNTNQDFQRLWKQYAAAALGVAGVSALASAQAPVQHIIYTPANITVDTGASRQTFISIDFNHDGIADLSMVASHFTDFFSGGGFAGYGRLALSQGPGGSAVVSNALPKGMIIDKGGAFKGGHQTIGYAVYGSYNGVKSGSARGAFVKITNKYLGVRFQLNGQMHEGWIRMTLSTTGDRIKGTITGYAYDTVPNETGLAAGQLGGRVGSTTATAKDSPETALPGSLGMLAAGASVIPYWRQ